MKQILRRYEQFAFYDNIAQSRRIWGQWMQTVGYEPTICLCYEDRIIEIWSRIPYSPTWLAWRKRANRGTVRL